MYVIGRTDYDLIKVAHTDTMYDGHKIWNEVRQVEYEADLRNATILQDHEAAKQLLQHIQSNVEEIKFTNITIIGQIIDTKSDFDKVAYSKHLKIYELVPTLVEKGECNR